jgi:DNA modification methylase
MRECIEINNLFSQPITSSRSGAFYNSFSYPTKISPETIALYIACLTSPNDTILDAFSGSGSTGIAALLCEKPTQKMINKAKELKLNPIWGKRNSILYEISTFATFATKTITNRLTSKDFKIAVESFINKANILMEEYYYAKSPNGDNGIIRYAIWSEIILCPDCETEIEYFKYGTIRNPATFYEKIKCPCCKNDFSIDNMKYATEKYNDKILGCQIERKKRKLVWVYGTTGKKNWNRAANEDDIKLLNKIENNDNFNNIPPKEIKWGDLHRTGYHFGITHLHHFYTTRNFLVFNKLWKLTEEYPEKQSNALKLLLLSYNSSHCTLMTRIVAKHNNKDFVLTGAQSGVLYISKLPVEKNIILGLKRKSKNFEELYKLLENCNGNIEIRNQTSTNMIEKDNSIDYIFTDPPFGDFIPYAEINQINELWLKEKTNIEDEIIISNSQNKTTQKYQQMLSCVFKEIKRVIKQNKPVTIVFHAAKATVWKAFANAIDTAGFNIKQTSYLDKTQGSFKQVISNTSVQGDPVFLLEEKDEKHFKNLNEKTIIEKIINENPHETIIEQRHCYSLYIGKCFENGITIKMDASNFYDYINNIKSAHKNEK